MSRAAGWRAAAPWRFRRILVALALTMTGIAGLRVSNTLSAGYPDDDPGIVQYRQFQSTCGSEETVVVAVPGPDRFDSDSGRQTVAELTGFAVPIAIVTDFTLPPAATRLCQLHAPKRGLVSH